MLETATELARDVGIRSFTIEELARRSGVAKTTIYRHFPSKNAIIIAALDGVTPVPTLVDTGSFRDDLVHFLGEVLPIFASRDLRALFLDLLAVSTFDPELAELGGSMMEGRGAALATIVTRAVDRGELPADLDLDTGFELIEGPLLIRSIAFPDALDDLDLDDLVTRIIARLHA